ncbi:MAG: DUF2807 domain-containing protein [Defluviitaleaceae bacterium]|nr:DUF2807 domain-containing protein [Defluviitaleaceae bacterium]MCL2835499.1 DUF2807 domain-containing protein [Defluviitaleaceae bacterium]
MMKRIFALVMAFACSAFALSGCFTLGDVTVGYTGTALRGNGNSVTVVNVIYEPIRRIEAANVSVTLNISAESSTSVIHTADSNLDEHLSVSLKDGVLTIDSNNRRYLGMDNSIIFTIGTDVLEGLKISGDAVINGDGTFTADTFSLNISGVANGQLDLDASTVEMTVSGAGAFTLTGGTDKLDIRSSGASSINTRGLLARDAKVNLSGAGSVSVYASENLDMGITGVGSITYFGSPDVSQRITGIGSIRKGD